MKADFKEKGHPVPQQNQGRWKRVLASLWACSFASLTSLVAAETTPAPYTAYVPFDSTKPLTDQQPGRYFLTYETFQALWKQARENKLEAARPPSTPDAAQPAWATIQTALYKGSIDGKRLLIDATLTLHSSGTWAAADLAFSGASLGGLTLDGAAAPLKDGHLLIEKTGPHTVTAKLEIPLPSNWQSVNCELPRAAASLVSLSLTEMSARLKLNHGLPTVETATADGLPTRVITAALGNANELLIERSLSASMANQANKLPSGANLVSSLYLSPALQRLESTVQFQFPGTDHQEFAIDMDPSITPISLDIPNLETWSLQAEKDKKTLKFRLALPVRDSLNIMLTGERQAPKSPSQETFPIVVPSATRLDRQQLILAVDELEVKPQPATIQQQTDFPDMKGMDNGFQRIGCFTSSGVSQPLPYSVQRRAMASSIISDYVYQISPSKLEIHAVFGIKPARGQDLLQTTSELPAGFTVTRVDSDRLQDWWVDANRLHVRFSGPTPERTTLLLGLAEKWKEPPAKLVLAPVTLENTSTVRGRAQLAALPDVQLQLNFENQKVTDVREIGPGEKREDYPPIGDFKLTSPFEAKREFTFDSANFNATVSLGKVPAKFDTRWVLAAEVKESWVRLEARCDVEVKAGALSEFTVALPPTAVASTDPRIAGEHVREVTKLPVENPEALVLYKISLQRPIVTDTQFTLSLEIPHNGEIHLPDLKFPDSGINERFLVVQNSSEGELHFEAARSAHVEPLQSRDVERDLHFRIQNFTQPLYFRAGPDWDLALTLEKLATTTGTKALVLYAELTTALRANGEEWLKAEYRLQNRSLQFLPVRLPQGFELLSALVNGQAVRADVGERDMQPVLLIPLIQTRPGDLALDVVLTGRRLPTAAVLDKKLDITLDDPELPGITIEKTVWKVALPPGYELNNHKGNMEKVETESAYGERQAAVLNELNSLISLSRATDNPAELRIRSKRNAQNLWSIAQAAGNQTSGGAVNQQIEELGQQLQKLNVETKVEAQVTTADGTWSWADNSGYLKSREVKQQDAQKVEAKLNRDNLGINDYIICGNRELFFKYNAAAANPNVPAEPQQLNSRSKAVSRLQQADVSDERTVNDQLKKLETQRSGDVLEKMPQKMEPTIAITAGTLTLQSQEESKPVTSDLTIRNNVDFVQNYQNAGNRTTAVLNGGTILQTPEVPKSAPMDQAAMNFTTANSSGFTVGGTVAGAYFVPQEPQKLRPAGRVSLPVNFPVTTTLTYFKKVKDHANLTISASAGDLNHGPRFSAALKLAAGVFVLFLLNALRKARRRRVRRKSMAAAH